MEPTGWARILGSLIERLFGLRPVPVRVRPRRLRRFTAIALLAIGAPASHAQVEHPSSAPPSAAADLRQAIADVRDRVFPTLVHIQPVFDVSVGGRKVESSATGSGVIVRSDGTVVTNFHVAGTAKRMLCTLSDRRKISAKLIGSDAATDLAVIQLELSELGLDSIAHADFNEAIPLEGDFVIAMGSPLGLTRSLSFGVVSCSKRHLGDLKLHGGLATGRFNTWIQTDAAINPGNSGGPLVDLDGRIVGINARGYEKADNLGFAIPAFVVRDVFDRILRDGRVIRSDLGIEIQPLREDAGSDRGALVASVEAGSPAAKAGIVSGDVIRRARGIELDVRFDEDVPDARRILADAAPAQPFEIVVVRDGKELTIPVTPIELANQQEQDNELEELGITLRVLTADERRQRFLDHDQALLITGMRAGGIQKSSFPKLKVGDVVLAVGDRALADAAALETAIESARADGSRAVLLTIARGRAEWKVAVQLDANADDVAKDGGR